MENVTIINFPKNKMNAKIIEKSTNEVSVDYKESIFEQLMYNAYDKKLNLKIKKLKRDHENDSYPFIMTNKYNMLVVNFEDKNDEYYQKFNKVYLQQKLKKENKIKKIKVFASRVTAAVLTTAMIGGLAYMTVDSYFDELDSIAERNKPYIEQVKQLEKEKEIEEFVREENKRIADEERKLVEGATNNTNSIKR